MSNLVDAPIARLQFYVTAPYPCSYLPARLARSQVATPSHLVDARVYGALVQLGFRRSGAFTYRPRCDQCASCLPVRVVAPDFKPSRCHRRTMRRLAALRVGREPLKFDSEHYRLYLRYQRARHPGGGMDHDSREQYEHFLLHSNVHTQLFTFREHDQLRAVSIVDELEDGLSCVYTFYDPSNPSSGFGTFTILWQIQRCVALDRRYVYLGYWIKESPKMAYKIGFRPMEGYIEGSWQRLSLRM